MIRLSRWLPGLLLLFSMLPAHAQPTKLVSPHVSTLMWFQQKVAVREYAELPCRLSVRVRADTAHSDGGNVRVAAFMLNRKRKSVGSLTLGKTPITSNTWQTYTLPGRLPKDADTVAVLGSVYRDVTAEFDDFRLEVETRPGQWQVVPLRAADFEQVAAGAAGELPAGWRSQSKTVNFQSAVVEAAPGQHVLRVQGRGTVLYGNNARAGRFATVNGVKLYYETYGQGEPLLLLHGNGESIESHYNQIGALAAHYRVIVVDTRGHGQSGNERRAYTYDLFADDMVALLDTLRLPAAHVVGWSDGGNTGLSMATRYPARVRSLVTMGANLWCDKKAVDPKIIRELRLIRAASLVLGPFNAQLKRARRLSTLLLKYPRMAPAQLAAVRAPTLVLAGEKDVIQDVHTRLIAQHIAGARLHVFPGLTHYAPQEDRTTYNDVLLTFLRQLPAAPDAAR